MFMPSRLCSFQKRRYMILPFLACLETILDAVLARFYIETLTFLHLFGCLSKYQNVVKKKAKDLAKIMDKIILDTALNRLSEKEWQITLWFIQYL
ncbi:5941_t:CDS:2 [Gigaspora margarita]|uniref:5941_t:CDS:1 n=1 Tax=Gigaspora margarita TaxID=4874 RepID=A0ABN7UZC3_GIGMA|nr:5941_t:CDS:2 [Gigaspora margarita]